MHLFRFLLCNCSNWLFTDTLDPKWIYYKRTFHKNAKLYWFFESGVRRFGIPMTSSHFFDRLLPHTATFIRLSLTGTFHLIVLNKRRLFTTATYASGFFPSFIFIAVSRPYNAFGITFVWCGPWCSLTSSIMYVVFIRKYRFWMKCYDSS